MERSNCMTAVSKCGRQNGRSTLLVDQLESRRLLASSGLPAAINIGGIGIDSAFAVAVDSHGDSVVAGLFSGTADFQPGSGVTNLTSVGQSDVFVAKYSPAGKLLWAKQFGGGAGKFDNRTIATVQQ